MPLQNVCVVSVMTFAGTEFETAFKDGFASAGTYITPKDNLGYDINNLRTNGVNLVPANSLVVAVGGLVAALAADGTTMPYIALTGADFTWSGVFLGGISLSASKHHMDRLAHLHYNKNNTPKNAAKTCLLYNGANPNFSNLEKSAFPYTQATQNIDQTTAGNAANIYATAFNNIDNKTNSDGSAANIEAIVVSADAFFTQTKDDLITAAGNRYMVYPFNDYRDLGNKKPKHQSSTIHGPKFSLVEVYCKMGVKARLAMSGRYVNWDHEPFGDPQDQ